MNAIPRKTSLAILLTSWGLVLVTASLAPVAGQPPLPLSPLKNDLPKPLSPAANKPKATVAADPKSEADKANLQGNWRMMSLDLGFKKVKREDNLAEFKGTFEGDMFFKEDRTGQIGHSNAKFKLDATRDPKQVTIYDDGGKLIFRGIYILEGDTLTMCMNGDGNSVCRPEEFVTKKGQAVVIMTYKRVPEKK